jgi:hypothetical protein
VAQSQGEEKGGHRPAWASPLPAASGGPQADGPATPPARPRGQPQGAGPSPPEDHVDPGEHQRQPVGPTDGPGTYPTAPDIRAAHFGHVFGATEGLRRRPKRPGAQKGVGLGQPEGQEGAQEGQGSRGARGAGRHGGSQVAGRSAGRRSQGAGRREEEGCQAPPAGPRGQTLIFAGHPQPGGQAGQKSIDVGATPRGEPRRGVALAVAPARGIGGQGHRGQGHVYGFATLASLLPGGRGPCLYGLPPLWFAPPEGLPPRDRGPGRW